MFVECERKWDGKRHVDTVRVSDADGNEHAVHHDVSHADGLEHADVFAKYNPRYAFGFGPSTPYTNLEVIKSPVANQRCPSDGGALTWDSISFYVGAQRYNYVANFGNLPLDFNNSNGILSRLSSFANGATTVANGGAPFLIEGTNPTSRAFTDVLFFPGSSAAPAGVTPMPTRVAVRRVADGLSKTMAFSEVLRNRDPDYRGLPYHAGQNFFMAWSLPNSTNNDRLGGNASRQPPPRARWPITPRP